MKIYLSVPVRSFLLATVLLISAPLLAQGAEQNSAPIIVTATPTAEYEKRLKACIERACPPNEDIDATLAYVEGLFIEGDYKSARQAIRKSVQRNRGHSKSHPVPVSELYRAAAVVDLHMGEHGGYTRSTIFARDALKAGLEPNDARILLAQIEVGDMRAALGYHDEASQYYKSVLKRAEQLNLPGVIARARLRDALLDAVRSGINSPYSAQYRKSARNKYEAIAAAYANDPSAMSLVAKIALARLDDAEGSSSEITQIIARYGGKGEASQRPTLLFAPALNGPSADGERARLALSGSVTTKMNTANAGSRWADIGFWVRPDGTTGDIQILRSDGNERWLNPVIVSIKGRRYTQTDSNSSDPGFFMMERYSFASSSAAKTGSRIPSPSKGMIVRVDLTVEPPQSVEGN